MSNLEQEEIGKLREGLMDTLYAHIPAVNKGILSCEELANLLLRSLPDYMKIDTGELTGKERIAVWEQYKKEHPAPELAEGGDAVHVSRLLKAARAKFKSIGELMK